MSTEKTAHLANSGDADVGERGRHSIGRQSIFIDVVALLLVVLAADAGIATEADGVLVAAAVALLRPTLLPYLLLLVAGFQDAKGLSGQWWYGGTVLLGLWLVASWWPQLSTSTQSAARPFRALVVLTGITILYAVVNSYLQDSFGIHPQSTTREPYMVGLLACLMVLVGLACAAALREDALASRKLLATTILVLGNGVAISIARVFLGYDHFLSQSGIAQMGEAQLTEDTPLGFPRLTGSYLTPIGFAMYVAFMFSLWEVHCRRDRISGWQALGYILVGVLLTFMSLSKGMAIYFIATVVVLLMLSPRFLIPAMACGVGFCLWVVNLVGTDAISAAFRIQQGTSNTSYRAIAWAETINHFSWFDWVFGTGFAYWPIFLERYAGFTLSDPHNYLLSIPGTYGVLGVAVYVLLAGCLLLAFRHAGKYARLSAASLMVMFFIANAVSIPYVIGNTPITAVIWAAIASLCTQNTRSGSTRL